MGDGDIGEPSSGVTYTAFRARPVTHLKMGCVSKQIQGNQCTGFTVQYIVSAPFRKIIAFLWIIKKNVKPVCRPLFKA